MASYKEKTVSKEMVCIEMYNHNGEHEYTITYHESSGHVIVTDNFTLTRNSIIPDRTFINGKDI